MVNRTAQPHPGSTGLGGQGGIPRHDPGGVFRRRRVRPGSSRDGPVDIWTVLFWRSLFGGLSIVAWP
jgi:hypothetical protein